jgi:hypothetical protein
MSLYDSPSRFLATTELMIGSNLLGVTTNSEVSKSSYLARNQLVSFDTQEYFTPREVREIQKSLLDFAAGNYRVFERTEDLFAYLDSE